MLRRQNKLAEAAGFYLTCGVYPVSATSSPNPSQSEGASSDHRTVRLVAHTGFRRFGVEAQPLSR